MFQLTRKSGVPLVDQIVERLAGLIRGGQLAEGARLPSIRKLARLVNASPFTVADAYDRLVARGLIQPRAGRGFFVSRLPVVATVEAIDAVPDPGADALALAQLAHSRHGDLIAAGSGCLPTSWLLDLVPAKSFAHLAPSRAAGAWMPCPPQGLPALRELLAARLVQQGIAASPAHIVTTTGASQAFDLLGRILLAPGDAVLVEDPGYFVLFEQLRAHHAQLVPIPRRADGPDLEALEAACRAHRPRAFFVQTLLHNPCGTSIDPARCHRLLSLAEQYGFALVEDDVYGDLYRGPAVRLAQLDGLRHVIYIGSFTKLVSQGVRLGFVAADPAMVAELTRRKVLAVLSGSTLLESLVLEVLDSGRYRRHVEVVREKLARMRRDSRRALESVGIRFDDEPAEGLFLWGRLPDGTDSESLVRRARDAGILLARGELFSPVRGCRGWLRFNVAHSAAPELTQFLRGALPAAA